MNKRKISRNLAIIFALISLFSISLIFSSCGSANRVTKGPPKLNNKGEKISGDNFEVDEYGDYANMMLDLEDRKNSQNPEEATKKGDQTEESKKGIEGYIVNKSKYKDFSLHIYNSSGKKIREYSIGPDSFLRIELPPSLNYTGCYDVSSDYPKGRYQKMIDAISTGVSKCEFKGSLLEGHYQFVKEK